MVRSNIRSLWIICNAFSSINSKTNDRIINRVVTHAFIFREICMHVFTKKKLLKYAAICNYMHNMHEYSFISKQYLQKLNKVNIIILRRRKKRKDNLLPISYAFAL